MFIFDVTDPLTLLLILAAVILLIFLAHERKKSYIALIPLIMNLFMLIFHGAQIFTLQEEYRNMVGILSNCLAIDFTLVGITFFSYLWVDDMETKIKGKKSIDNTLDWFWKNV